MQLPTDRLYTASHEWVKLVDGCATVGLTDFAQSELGDVVFINLPEVNDEVKGDEIFGDIESVKAVSDVISPVSGTVVEINEELLDDPSEVNRQPYDAWLIKVNPAEVTVETMDAAAYEAQCRA